jgi:hypothetical protein
MADNINSIHSSHKGGAIIPNRWESFTLHDTNKLNVKNVVVRVAVSAAGNVVLEDWDDNEVTFNYPVAGVYEEVGQWQRAKATGLTATLVPANTVHGGYVVNG